MSRESGRRKLGSVRVRLTLSVTLLFAIGLIIMSAVMVSWIRATLIDEVTERNTELLTLASERIGPTIDPNLVLADELALPLPDAVREDLEAIAGGARLEMLLPPGTKPAPRTNVEPLRLSVIGELLPEPVDSKNWMSTEVSFGTSMGTSRLVAASPLIDVQQSVALVKQTMWVFIPSMVLAVGSFAWIATGRALRPVEEITDRVSDITSATLFERVPVPPTGDEIAMLATTMNDMLDRLEASAQREKQFLSNASHELRSPVAAIKAQLETAVAYPESAEWPVIATAVSAQVARLDDLVDNLFMLSRLDESLARPLTVTEVDLDEIVMANTSHIAHVHVDTRSVGAARVAGDSVLLTSVVRNLVENAARYATSTIAVRLTRGIDSNLSPVAILVVDDDGAGIPDAQRDRVFERFARLDEGRARGHGGAGIGLALVKSAIERHGGSVRLIDGTLGGACFEVVLPLWDDDDDDDEPDDIDAPDGVSASDEMPSAVPPAVATNSDVASRRRGLVTRGDESVTGHRSGTTTVR